ncbi:unnamed protein product [Lymnaea stagnalis]|uniref:FHF complex subunit HOOK-interacting protein C-terminal domain-containing protein n=1 Tax=Lymnaea stagnalis TaxID=6523 RepID=A0AAV2HYN4_LYMST
MKKAMFHKFTNFLQQAVETFAPNVSPQEEFVYHWKSVTSYFVDNKDGGARIEETALPEHLSSMLRILQEEESDLGEAGTTGMCMEYLLQHRLLETLYTLGRTDHPPGMKQMVLSFFTKLLSRISHPLLPHINVHRAVQRLVKACGETKAGPAEKEEIEFLCTVCAKIKTDPYLVNFFIEPWGTLDLTPTKEEVLPSTTTAWHRSLRKLEIHDLVVPWIPYLCSLCNSKLWLTRSNAFEKSSTSTSVCLLFSKLVVNSSANSRSWDARVSVKACEGLMLCASLPEQSAAAALIGQTQFCQSVAGILCSLYVNLPLDASPDNIEGVEAKWGQQGFSGKRQLTSFLSWLDYCDQLIAVANPDVGEALAAEIHKQLLTGHILPLLMQASESGLIIATAYVTRCLRTVCSQALLREFVYFLLGKDRSFEVKDNSPHLVSKRLLERCNHISEEVCIATMKLFDTLLQKEDEQIFHCLILRNLLGRSYLASKRATASQACTTVQHEVHKTEGEELVGSPAVSVQELEDLAVGVQDSLSVTANAKLPETLLGKSQEPNSLILETDVNSASSTDTSVAEHSKSILSNTDTLTSAVVNETLPSDSVSIPPQIESTITSVLSHNNNSNAAYTSAGTGNTQSVPGLGSPIFGQTEVHKVVNCFLTLLPEEAKSSYQTADSGYDMYLRDAHKQFAIQETVCKQWAWPHKPLALPGYEMTKFYEGSFLHMLLEKLLHILDQSYSVNLLLTALIAKVALIPHPNLHEFLLDPFLPTVEGARTLYSVLVKVTNEIKHHQKSDTAFSQKLILARKQLLGLVPTIHSLRLIRNKPELHWFEDQSRMEAVIVLEEFCKELSAIAFVKHHAAVTRL